MRKLSLAKSARGAAESSLVVLRGKVGKQTARVLFADDFELCQGNEERLANAECRHAVGFIEAWLLCHEMSFRPLIYRGQTLTDPDPH